MGRSKRDAEPEDDGLERAPWEEGALTVDVTSVPADIVLKNCLSNDLNLRLTYIKGLASAATRATRRELPKLLEAISTLLDDEAVGVRQETLQQLQQLAKLADCTTAPEEVREAVEDALEQQLRPALDPGGAAGTGALPMVREELLATLDAVCTALGPGRAAPLLMRMHRAANAAQDKPGGVGAASGGGGAAVGGMAGIGASKASCDAALMALSMAAVAVRHLAADRGGLAAAALAGRLGRHGDIRVREAVAAALPRVYRGYAAAPGSLEDLFASFESLCDDKVWSVKQAAARAVGPLAQLFAAAAATTTSSDTAGVTAGYGHGDCSSVHGATEEDQRRRQRAEAFQKKLVMKLLLGCLLPSKSQWVLTAARQQLGPAIAALLPGLAAECLPPLLEAFCAAAAVVGQGAVEVRRAAAASFADVAVKAGPQHWSQLQPVFTRLLASTDVATLCSLVAGAERIVRLLAGSGGSSSGSGQVHDAGDTGGGCADPAAASAAARAVVSGPLLEVLRSRLHLVAPAASGALAGLLGVCPPELQAELLKVLPPLCAPPAGDTGRCGDWRPRLSLAASLHAAMRAVAPAAGPDAAAAVARCAITLCADPVWAVRQAAAAQVGLMLADAVPVAAGGAGGAVRGDAGGSRRVDGAEEAAAEQQGGSWKLGRGEAVQRGEGGAGASSHGGTATASAPQPMDGQQCGDHGGDQLVEQAEEALRNCGAERPESPKPGDVTSAVGALSVSDATADHDGASTGADVEACASCSLTSAQRAWLSRAVQLAGPSNRECSDGRGVGGGCGDGGAGGRSGHAILAEWLLRATSQGTRAEEALVVACCRSAAERVGLGI